MASGLPARAARRVRAAASSPTTGAAAGVASGPGAAPAEATIATSTTPNAVRASAAAPTIMGAPV